VRVSKTEDPWRLMFGEVDRLLVLSIRHIDAFACEGISGETGFCDVEVPGVFRLSSVPRNLRIASTCPLSLACALPSRTSAWCSRVLGECLVLTSAWLRCSARNARFTPPFPVAEMLLLRVRSGEVRSSELFRAIVGTSSRSPMAAGPRAFALIDVAARCSAVTVTSGSGPGSSVRCRPSACTGITGCRMRGASTELLCLISAGPGGCVKMSSWACSGVRCLIDTGLVDRSDKDGRVQSSLNGSGLVREPASQSVARPRSPLGRGIVQSPCNVLPLVTEYCECEYCE
jgi:hypothetical protein